MHIRKGTHAVRVMILVVTHLTKHRLRKQQTACRTVGRILGIYGYEYSMHFKKHKCKNIHVTCRYTLY